MSVLMDRMPRTGAKIGISRERLDDIDRATGLAITLVVLGHLAPGKIFTGAEWVLRSENCSLYFSYALLYVFIRNHYLLHIYSC